MKHIKNHKTFLLLSCLLPVLLGGCAISTLPADIPVPEDSQTSQDFSVPKDSQTSQDFSVPEGSQLSQDFSAPSSGATPEEPQIEEEYFELTKRVSLDGTYGTITLSLPDDWNYSLCDNSILIHPESAEEGYLEIGYTPLFGTCGTGLTEKESTLVLPSSITDWSDSDLEEIWIILDSLEWVPSGV